MKLNCGAERLQYSMFNVGRSMFDVRLYKITLDGINVTRECLQNNSLYRFETYVLKLRLGG